MQTSTRSSTDAGLLVLRLFAGLALAFAHGMGHVPPSANFVSGVAGMGFPAPLMFAWAAGLSELVGGMLLAIGLFTRPASVFILITMCVAGLIKTTGPFLEREKPLLYGAVALMYIVAGPGRLSLDRVLRERRRSEERRE